MQIKHVAVISGEGDRAATVGIACRDALSRVVHAEHFVLADLQTVPRREFDLYLYIDDEPRQIWPHDLRPAAWWLIDGRESLDKCAAAAPSFEHVFAARRSTARLLGERGVHAHWLPPACGPNPSLDHEPRLTDVCLIGQNTEEQFKATAELLRKRLASRRFSLQNVDEPERRHFDCRIAVALETSSWLGFAPIEAVASGAVLLIEQSEAVDLLGTLRDGVHYISYCGPHELLAQITFYLKRQDLWNRISRGGRMQATTHCDYFSRMQQLLEECGKSSRGRQPRGKKVVGSQSTADQLLAIIPAVGRVLDLDCLDGSLAERLKARQQSTITGITPHQCDAVEALNCLEKVYIGHAPELCRDLPPHSFDCILLRDWLERVENPAQLLRDVRCLLAPGGCAIAQVSNVGHYRRVASLLNGNWTYGVGGAAPAGAINLFTRSSVERWFTGGGWDVRQVVTLRDWQPDAPLGAPDMAALKTSGVFNPMSPCDPRAEGYLLKAEPIARPFEPPTIIVISLNRSPDLRAFVGSLLLATDVDAFDLLFIDRGWDEDAKAFLRSVEPTLRVSVSQLRADASFVEAITEGMRKCRGKSVALVSPNTRFTPDWLRRLLATLESDRHVDLVAPRIVLGKNEESILLRADHVAAELAGSSTLAGEVSCACLLVRRDRMPEIEWIHPKGDRGGDTGALAVARLSKAAIKKGSKAMIAQDACVWSEAATDTDDEWSRLLATTGQGLPVAAGNAESTMLPCGRRILDLRVRPALRNLEGFVSRELVEAQRRDSNPGFDCILIDDLLSCVPDPLKTLNSLRGCLDPSGALKARFPNLCHHRVIGDLLDGRPLTLCTRGGSPPLRYFTRREVEKLFYRAGFAIRSIEAAPKSDENPGATLGHEHDDGDAINCGSLRICGLEPGEMEQFRASAYVVDAVPLPVLNYAKTSILINAGPHIEITRRCIDCVRQRTDEPYELIVLTEQGAVETELRRLQGITMISPLPGESRQVSYERGIQRCTGKHIVLLDDRVTVTSGWLQRMLRALYCEKSIAAVGPCSNAGIGPQAAPPAHELSLLGGIAWEWGKAHDELVEEAACLMPSCLLLRLQTIKQLGNPEPAQIAARLAEAGKRAVVARDSYVHSWAEPDTVVEAIRPCEPAVPAMACRAETTGPDLILVRDRLPISLCMIVRDSARTLGRCLRSIRPWVSEMIVVDTGSLDRTPELARRLGARVFHFPWCCDFAAARNESIRHARGQWIFWMDADDTIDGVNGRRLSELAAAPAPPSLLGYVMQVHCPGSGDRGEVTAVDHVKLFRNRPDLRFQGRIHEQILPAIRRAGGEVGWTDLFVTHSGADYSAAGRRRKFARDVRLLHLELRDRPDHTFTLFNLGMTHADIGEHSTAVQYLRQSLARSEAGESHVRKIYALLAASLSHLERNNEAYETCLAGLKSFPLDAELNFRAAIAAHRLGELAEAERLYIKVIAGGDSRHFSSVDRGIAGFKAHYNLAGAYRDMNRVAEAEAQYLLVTEAAPLWADGWRALVNLRIDSGRFPEAEQDLMRMANVPSLAAEKAQLERHLEKSRRDETAPARI